MWQLKYFLFSPLLGEDEPILTNIFQLGWNHQLANHDIVESNTLPFLILDDFQICWRCVLTAKAIENQWFEDDSFPLGMTYFKGLWM